MVATGLPIIVAVTNIGTENGELASGTATAMVGAGMLTVLVFPALATSLLGRSPLAGTAEPLPDELSTDPTGGEA